MSTGTGIEWTQATWNPVVGCTRASAGCDHCYAVAMTHRLEAMGQEKYKGLTVLNPRGERHFNGVVRTDEAALAIPLKWRKPRRVFVNSMSDLFHKDVPFEFIDKVFAVMALTPRHTYQVLTKRPERMAEYLAERTGCHIADVVEAEAKRYGVKGEPFMWPLPNVWLGTSCEDQAEADARIPWLLRCPAAVRFVSAEPLLGAVDLHTTCINKAGMTGDPAYAYPAHAGIDWVIVGGESGPGARPCDVGWVRSIVGQCKSAGVACFVKQLGGMVVEDERAWGDRSMAGSTRLLSHTRDRRAPDGTVAWAMSDPKGSDMAEWPEEMRVREFPKEHEHV